MTVGAVEWLLSRSLLTLVSLLFFALYFPLYLSLFPLFNQSLSPLYIFLITFSIALSLVSLSLCSLTSLSRSISPSLLSEAVTLPFTVFSLNHNNMMELTVPIFTVGYNHQHFELCLSLSSLATVLLILTIHPFIYPSIIRPSIP